MESTTASTEMPVSHRWTGILCFLKRPFLQLGAGLPAAAITPLQCISDHLEALRVKSHPWPMPSAMMPVTKSDSETKDG